VSRHKRRSFAVKPQTGANSEINVTPLVDVVLVLLIIFMVVTPLLEKEINVRVPNTEEVTEVKDVPPDQLVVRIAADGKLSVNDTEVSDEAYEDELRKQLLKPRATGRLVFFAADEQANYAVLVRAMDRAKKAGADTLGMMTELPEAKPN
jgi:biopolymer transport protein TolR